MNKAYARRRFDEAVKALPKSRQKNRAETAKAVFDALGGNPVSKVVQLSEEYAALLAEKKACYEEYKTARKEMIAYQKAKQNIDMILGIDLSEQEKQKEVQR